MPRGKSAQLGEASNSAPTEGTKQTPRVEPIIWVSLKKVFNQPPLYNDTEPSIGSKVPLPSLNDLFNKFKHSDYLEFTPHSSPKIRAIYDQVFSNISHSLLHMVVARSPVLPYVEALEWVINHTYAAKCLINDEQGQCVLCTWAYIQI